MIQTSTRPQRRREKLRGYPTYHVGRTDQRPVATGRHIGPSKYMPHIGAKQRAKAASRAVEV
jgi:hypothetical protein